MSPALISSLKCSSPPVFFLHVINPVQASLTVQVLGLNLELVFRHTKAKQVASASTIVSQLERKTVGFLVFVAPGTRTVLTTAESGHGSGRYGDVLDVQENVLPNSIWARRVVSIGETLGLNMARPYDNMGFRGNRPDLRGIFLGSHVEVKLAVHGICVLLEMFEITRKFDHISKDDLSKLRTVTLADGSRPFLEVYFSRKNCKPCGKLVEKLQEITGISIHLLWKDRLEVKTYPQPTPRPVPNRSPREDDIEVINVQNMEIDDQDLDFGDELLFEREVVCIDSEPLQVLNIEHIDIVEIVPPESHPLEAIDLTDLQSPSPSAIEEGDDAFIDGWAQRVGQMDASPGGATRAIVEFVQKMQSRRPPEAQHPSSRPPLQKPLPARLRQESLRRGSTAAIKTKEIGAAY